MPEAKKKADAFDDAIAEAAQADAEITVSWHGLELTAKPPSKWAFVVQYYAREGDLPSMVEAIFGADGLAAVIASGHTDMAEITELLTLAQGADSGNDPTPSS